MQLPFVNQSTFNDTLLNSLVNNLSYLCVPEKYDQAIKAIKVGFCEKETRSSGIFHWLIPYFPNKEVTTYFSEEEISVHDLDLDIEYVANYSFFDAYCIDETHLLLFNSNRSGSIVPVKINGFLSGTLETFLAFLDSKNIKEICPL